MISIFADEITQQIDADIIEQLGLSRIIALNNILRKFSTRVTSITLKKLKHEPCNDRLRFPHHVPDQIFPHSLSWKNDLGQSCENWENRLQQFRPMAPWSHHSVAGRDVTFYFISDEDQVAFLLLMS